MHEFENIPSNQISTYFKIPVDPNNNSGLLVIRDASTKDILLDGRNLYMFLSLPYPAFLGASNTFLVKFTDNGDDISPPYECETIFDKTR